MTKKSQLKAIQEAREALDKAMEAAQEAVMAFAEVWGFGDTDNG